MAYSYSNIANACNPQWDYSFFWTIVDFHKTLKVRGAPFLPIRNCPDEFCLELKLYDDTRSKRSSRSLFLKLISVNHSYDYLVEGTIDISTEQNILLGKSSKVYKTIFEKNTCIDFYEIGSVTKKLPSSLLGSLIVKGTLRFSKHKSASRFECSGNYSRQSAENCCRELSLDLKSLYESGLSSEIVTFTIDQKEITAHKTILCSNSPVFKKMFEEDTAEKNTNKVNIEDIDFAVFISFLMFLYTGVIRDEEYEFVVSLYSVSKKYQVFSLQRACFLFLSNKLTVEYVWDALQLAELHSDEVLKEVVKVYVRKNFVEIAGTAKWAEFITTQPKLLKEIMDFMKLKI